MPSTPSTQHRGFTLLELLITVALIGILGAIAYPSYTSQVTRSRRAEAKVVLSKAALWMERNRSNTFTYVVPASGGTAATTNAALVAAGLGRSPEGTGTQYYSIAVSKPTADSYELVASLMGTQATNDPKCALVLNHLGRQGRINETSNKIVYGGDAQLCWQN